MPRQRTNREGKTINFDKIVLKYLVDYCRRNHVDLSLFVNETIRNIVVDEEAFAREMSKQHQRQLQFWKEQADYHGGRMKLKPVEAEEKDNINQQVIR